LTESARSFAIPAVSFLLAVVKVFRHRQHLRSWRGVPLINSSGASRANRFSSCHSDKTSFTFGSVRYTLALGECGLCCGKGNVAVGECERRGHNKGKQKDCQTLRVCQPLLQSLGVTVKTVNRLWLLVMWLYFVLSVSFWFVNRERFVQDVTDGARLNNLWNVFYILYLDRIISLLFSSAIIISWRRSRTLYYVLSIVFLALLIADLIPPIAIHYLGGSMIGDESFGYALYFFIFQIFIGTLFFTFMLFFARKDSTRIRQKTVLLVACISIALYILKTKRYWYLLYLQLFDVPRAQEAYLKNSFVFVNSNLAIIISSALTAAALWTLHSIRVKSHEP
jgi:hypothetical protein